MAFFTLAILAPLVYVDETFDEQMHHILVTLPVFLISAAVVRYLRDTLTQREREYRRFAAEAVTLAERIRGAPEGAKPEVSEDVDERLAELARGREPRLSAQIAQLRRCRRGFNCAASRVEPGMKGNRGT